MILHNSPLFLNQTTVLFDKVGVDATTLLCVIMAGMIKDGRPLYLISPTEPLQKFKMLLRKLNAPDLTLLEAQGKFKFSSQFTGNIESKYFVMVHGASFMALDSLCVLVERPNTLLHIHKDIETQVFRYLIGACNLVIDASPLASGFSQQIFCRLAIYPGGSYHNIVKEAKWYTVSTNADTSVTLVDA